MFQLLILAMQLEAEVMLGSRHKPATVVFAVVMVVAFVCCIGACQNNNHNTQTKYAGTTSFPLHDEKRDSLHLLSSNALDIAKYQQKSIADIFNRSKEYAYPDNIDFVPTYLSDDDKLYGEADLSGSRSQLVVAEYDLETDRFRILTSFSGHSKFGSIAIISASKKYVLYEEIDQNEHISRYFLLNLYSGKCDQILEIKNIPSIHYSQAIIVNDGIMINHSLDGMKYINSFYSFSDKTLFAVEDRNCGFPVFYKNKWYYIVIDSKNKNTSLVMLDINNKRKSILFSRSSETTYISGLYSEDNNLYLTIVEDGVTSLFRIDLMSKTLIPLFKSEWVESVKISHGFMSWLGSSMIKNRVRPEYFIFDLRNNVLYQNEGGPVFLSDSGIVWIRYKKDDDEIRKGQLYKNENTSIVFQKR